MRLKIAPICLGRFKKSSLVTILGFLQINFRAFLGHACFGVCIGGPLRYRIHADREQPYTCRIGCKAKYQKFVAGAGAENGYLQRQTKSKTGRKKGCPPCNGAEKLFFTR